MMTILSRSVPRTLIARMVSSSVVASSDPSIRGSVPRASIAVKSRCRRIVGPKQPRSRPRASAMSATIAMSVTQSGLMTKGMSTMARSDTAAMVDAGYSDVRIVARARRSTAPKKSRVMAMADSVG